jgi:adenylate cyclase
MLRILIRTNHELRRFEHAQGPLEVGRGNERDLPRLVLEDPFVSRDHLRIEPLADGRVRVENISRKNPVTLHEGDSLDVGAAQDCGLPLSITIGETHLLVEGETAVDSPLMTIRQPVLQDSVVRNASLRELGEAPPADVLAQWLERVVTVQRSAAGSNAFYLDAAKAVVDLVGLDSSCVLLQGKAGWEIVARHPQNPRQSQEFSHTVIERVASERRTFYESFRLPQGPGSLSEIEAVVASPILDDQGQAVGVLYGSRLHTLSGTSSAISPIEAQVVQLLAAASGAGLARLAREAQAARMRVQFEQFFSPELARELERDPALLEGREREITVLFADVRGFSAIAERAGPRETFRLMSDVLDRLTSRVMDAGGVVIDYYGDGMAVMWNAPLDQADHARRACQAALALRGELPQLNDSWRTELGRSLEFGIGIHTGPALVGNSGSARRLKYGPRGHTMNLASRIEQATKWFGAPILATGATVLAAGDVAARRLCRVRAFGVAGAVDLYEVRSTDERHDRQAAWNAYSDALAQFEQGDWQAARQRLEHLAMEGDAAAGAMAAHCASLGERPPADWDGVVELASK